MKDERTPCPHCVAGEPSVWDSGLECYAHPAEQEGKLKLCWTPWAERDDAAKVVRR